MIEMPKRSVTRYFIPLIDVMLLLFVVFLLMPIANERDKEGEVKDAARKIEILKRQILALEQRLKRVNDYPDRDKLLRELDRLRELEKKPLQERTAFHLIDIDRDTGEISFFDTANAKSPRIPLNNELAVKDLIKRHTEEAKGRDLFYFFLRPRPVSGYPTAGQRKQYEAWFGDTPNTFRKEKR